MDWEDDELQLIIKSVGITYDVTARKLVRLSGRRYDEAVAETETCNHVLAKAREEQAKRWRATAVS